MARPIKRIKLHGKHGIGKYALVDGDYDGEYFNQFRWYVSPVGYAYRGIKPKGHSYLHHEVLATVPKGMWRDHINGDKLDNRGCNLRLVTPKESAQNRTYAWNQDGKSQTKTGYRGVAQVSAPLASGERRYYPLWAARIQRDYLGCFPTPEAAAEAYRREAAKRYTHQPHQSITPGT